MGHLFSSDAINNMFDSDGLPYGRKVLYSKKKSRKRNDRFFGMRVFDPFEIMDQADEAGNLDLFIRFFEELSSAEIFFDGRAREQEEIKVLPNNFYLLDLVDQVEEFFENTKTKRFFGKISKKPIFVVPRKLRLV